MGVDATVWIKESHRITPRRPRFDLDQTPKYWLADDPLGTHLLNVMQLLAPAPERWFCQAFRDALPYVRDARLREAAQAFIKQEGAHVHGHTQALRRIEQLGIDTEPYCRFMDWLFADMLGTRPLGRELKQPWARRGWLKTRLAMVAATEHLTGVLGNWVLNTRGFDDAPVDAVMWDLYRWHGAEEVEHREVADAMFRHVSGNLALRSGAALFIFPLFLVLALTSARFLVCNDPALPFRLRLRDVLRVARQGRLPAPRATLIALLRYFSPRHSPLDEGSTEQDLAYLAQREARAK